MMKGTTFVWAGLIVAAAGALFLLKFEVQAQEQRLNSLRKEIVATRENIHVLKAEWSYLNDPQRLREQAERHLGMRILTPDQIGDIAALPPAQPKDKVLAETNDTPSPAPVRPAATPARVAAAAIQAPAPAPQPKAAPPKTAQPAPAAPRPAPQIATPALPRETPRTAPPAEAHPSQPRPVAPAAPPSVPVSYPAAPAPSAGGNVTVILSPALMQERRQ